MEAASTPPEQENKMRARNNRPHVPPEIVEEILLNLPVKSLVRFSSISQSWNSMIFELGFIKRHHSRAALPSREMTVISQSRRDYLDTASFCRLSSMTSEEPIEDATDLICPFQGKPYLHAFCDELWCVQVENSLFLWNPSMNTYIKIPDPSIPPRRGTNKYQFVYGLGYDSVGDDYKILTIPRVGFDTRETELYSLKSNSWRKIQSFSRNPLIRQKKCEFVNGALHWIDLCEIHAPDGAPIIISFDLSTEKHEEVPLPKYYPMLNDFDRYHVEVVVLRGMLCLCLNYCRVTTFVLWGMEDYGVEKSWTKMFGIDYSNGIPYFPSKRRTKSRRTKSRFVLRPLNFYDNGDILIKVSTDKNDSEIFMYKKGEAIPKKIVGRGRCSSVSNAFLYVESLISPATWLAAASVGGNDE